MPKDESLSGMTVLLVDDETFSRKLVANMLLDMGRPTIIEAANGADALSKFNESDNHIDFVVSDFNMPEVHGLQLLRAIRTMSDEKKRSTPFAMVSGYSERILVDMALLLDANAFLTKPVSHAGLRKRILKMLELVKSNKWLKHEDQYNSIDIAGILDEIASPEKKGERDATIDLLPIELALLSPGRRKFNSAPVEVRGGIAKKISGSNKFGEHELSDKKSPSSGSVETRGLTAKHKLKSGKVELRDRNVSSGSVEVRGMGQDDGSEHTWNVDEVPNAHPDTLARTGVAASERLCSLAQLPHSPMLSRDVITADGRVFMHGGTRMTPLMIAILHDLEELGHPVESVWIET